MYKGTTIGFKTNELREQENKTIEAIKHIEMCKNFAQDLLDMLLDVDEQKANDIMDSVEGALVNNQNNNEKQSQTTE